MPSGALNGSTIGTATVSCLPTYAAAEGKALKIVLQQCFAIWARYTLDRALQFSPSISLAKNYSQLETWLLHAVKGMLLLADGTV